MHKRPRDAGPNPMWWSLKTCADAHNFSGEAEAEPPLMIGWHVAGDTGLSLADMVGIKSLLS